MPTVYIVEKIRKSNYSGPKMENFGERKYYVSMMQMINQVDKKEAGQHIPHRKQILFNETPY